MEERKKNDKYLDLARELKKLWNMKVIVKPFIIGALGTVTKGLGEWVFVFYGISIFVSYLMPNPFLYKSSVLFQNNSVIVSIVSMSECSISNNSVKQKFIYQNS